MTRLLEHRGPDDEAFWSGQGAFLGHRRLSIIDIEGGCQPMSNEHDSVHVVFNGEIYNHHELQCELAEKGHEFVTRSDTEVLVHLWEEEGEAMLGRLQGMFAFALFDERERSLLLARDLMGKKPLFFGEFKGILVFASEMRSILTHPDVVRRVDPSSLYRYLTLDYVPTPRSMIEGVRKVRAGGYALFKDGQVREGLYRDIRVPDEPVRLSRDEAANQVWDTLVRATGARLESDVPLGVFLSGGLDSAAVVAAMAEHISPSSISTFTIGFDDPSYDESGHAGTVADHLGTDHHVQVLTGGQARDLVQECTVIADEPLGDYSVIPTYLLSKFAREQVTVVLSGDGGDELFYGYPTFNAHRLADVMSRVLPRRVTTGLLPAIASRVPVSDRDWDLGYRLRRFTRGLGYGKFERHFAWIGGFDPGSALEVMHPDLAGAVDPESPYPDCDDRLSHCVGWPEMKALSYVYARMYLEDGVLVKVDRASMAVGLEVRSPFLDPEMVDLAFSLPSDYSLSRTGTKLLLRRALRGRVPEEILARPKKGFGMPLARWLRSDLKPLVNEVLSSPKLVSEGYFSPEVVRGILAAHMSGRSNLRKEIFNLMVFEMWLSRYLT